MIEYQIILHVFLKDQGGRTIKQVVRSSDRETAIQKFKYLTELATDKKRVRELQEWADENLTTPGEIVGTSGLFGVSYIQIL
jgi:hypothetical protein